MKGVKKILNSIENGDFFDKPFQWLYELLAFINIIFPVYVFYLAVSNHIFKIPMKFTVSFFIIWAAVLIISVFSFFMWRELKKSIPCQTDENSQYLLSIKFVHFLRSFGIWSGLWVGTVGFFFAVTTTFMLGQKVELLYKILGVSFLGTGYLMIILMPIYGFFIIFLTHFIAEIITLIVKKTIKQNK